MQSLKEKASNVAASAKSGMEKTKATVQEKVEKMKALDPTEKAMATEKKDERIYEAEMNKQVTQDRNAALQQRARARAPGGHIIQTQPRVPLDTLIRANQGYSTGGNW